MSETNNPIDSEAVAERIRQVFGHAKVLAALMEVTPQAVSFFTTQGFPLDRAIEVDILSNGDIPWRFLCPSAHQKFDKVRTDKAPVSDRQLNLPFDLADLNTLS